MDRTVQLMVLVTASAWDDADGSLPTKYSINLGDSIFYIQQKLEDSIASHEDARKYNAEYLVEELYGMVEKFFDNFPIKELADGWHRA